MKPGVRCALLVLCALLTACGRDKVRSDSPGRTPDRAPASGGGKAVEMRDGGPPVPPDVSRIPEPVPRAEPRAAYGNKSPYTVLGRTYSVMPSSKGYKQRGIASWYGTKFHGRLTSSREPYDMYQFTAAHKTLPLPTYVRVTHLDNGRSITVKVNDRGPFHPDRIIDLSYAAAVKLGMHLAGTARVEVRALEAGGRLDDVVAPRSGVPQGGQDGGVAAPTAAAPRTSSVSKQSVFLQVGSFANRDNAKRLEDRLEDADIDDVSLDRERVDGRTVHRVRVGPFDSEAEAAPVAARLARLGVRAVVVSAE